MTIAILAFITVLGLVAGSFINVLISRLPRRMAWRDRQIAFELLEQTPDDDPEPPGMVWPGSHCPQCGYAVRKRHNIPVLGYLLLRGRCADCHNPIGWQYPVVELLTGVSGVLSFMLVGGGLGGALAVMATWLLIGLSGIDLVSYQLPDEGTLALLWIGLFTGVVTATPAAAIIGALCGYLGGLMLDGLGRGLFGKPALGQGDWKLAAAIGAWVGWPGLIVAVMAACLSAIVASAAWFGRTLPFGPCLAVGGWLSLVAGDWLIDGYLSFAGLS